MDELITKQQAIDALNEVVKDHSITDFDAIASILDLPPAQPEPNYDEWCDSCKEYDKEKHCCPRWNRVIKNTVDELKSVQPELCEDAVSRTDALKFKCDCYDSEWHLLYAVPTGYILRLKPVTPKQRTGKWINGKCDKCGEHAPFYAMASTYHESNFCPHCGAKMRGTLWE